MLTREELMFFEQGIYKAIERDVSTKERGNLRSEVNEYYINQYIETGGKSFEARIGGEKVGSVSVSPGKKTVKREAVVSDPKAAMKWAIENGFVEIDMKAVERHFAETGEVGDGIVMDRWEYETEPRVTLRIQPEKVFEHASDALMPVVAGLLAGGGDGE